MSDSQYCLSLANCEVLSELLHLDPATNANECAEECNTREACDWFTYDSEGAICILTEDRESISTCTTCTYGHAGCIQGGSSGSQQ